ncbi:MAG: hypothetical protein ACLQRH_14780 [Acidimicrobiales bacterium]
MVGRVRRRDRKHMPSAGDYGRLCDECVADLVRAYSAVAPPESGPVRLTVVRDRDVA